MKVFNVIYQNRLLFNKDNGKRLVLKSQHHYKITGDDESFEEQDSLNLPPFSLMNSKEIERHVKIQYPDSDIRKLFDAGQLFVFRVGLGKTEEGDDSQVFHFSCRTFEDLYAYRKDETKLIRLCPCNCIVEKCLTENLMQFESVYADSLNKAASNTITHYFSFKRSSAMNVLREFKPVAQIDYRSFLGGYDRKRKSLAGIDIVIKKVFEIK